MVFDWLVVVTQKLWGKVLLRTGDLKVCGRFELIRAIKNKREQQRCPFYQFRFFFLILCDRFVQVASVVGQLKERDRKARAAKVPSKRFSCEKHVVRLQWEEIHRHSYVLDDRVEVPWKRGEWAI